MMASGAWQTCQHRRAEYRDRGNSLKTPRGRCQVDGPDRTGCTVPGVMARHGEHPLAVSQRIVACIGRRARRPRTRNTLIHEKITVKSVAVARRISGMALGVIPS